MIHNWNIWLCDISVRKANWIHLLFAHRLRYISVDYLHLSFVFFFGFWASFEYSRWYSLYTIHYNINVVSPINKYKYTYIVHITYTESIINGMRVQRSNKIYWTYSTVAIKVTVTVIYNNKLQKSILLLLSRGIKYLNVLTKILFFCFFSVEYLCFFFKFSFLFLFFFLDSRYS